MTSLLPGFITSIVLLGALACSPTIMPVTAPGVAPAPMVPAVEGTPIPLPTPTPAAWVPIYKGDCPPTHPIKANPQSRIYHLPVGDSSYGRLLEPTTRCYADTVSVERDGYRHAAN